MGETFYTELGVSRDADEETISRAYREQVKESHPDVSDSPDASRRFKRLTTARDVLVDADERRRYDSLGHDTYVRRHVETPVWTAAQTQGSTAGTTGDGANAGTTGRGGHATGRTGEGTSGQSGQATQRAGGPSRQSTDRASGGGRSGQVGEGATPDGGYGANWQQAPDAYMRSDEFRASTTPGRTFRESLSGLGPWLFVHGVLLTSAVGTGSFVLARALTDPHISLPAALFLIVMLSLVVVISILHLVTEAYS